MTFETMSNKAVAAEIGRRVEQLRLERNLTQEQVALEVGLSRGSYRNLVNGGGKVENLVAVLRVLGRLDLVEQFIPETPFSPMAQLEMQGRKRRRAAGRRKGRGESSAEVREEEGAYGDGGGLDW